MADSGAKRQSSTSSHRREGPRDPLPISNPNIFSDDFALEPLEVSDQSTPSMIAGDDISPISTVSLSPRLPGPSHSAVSPRELPSRNRSSSGYGGSDRSSFRTERFSQNYVPSVGSVSDPRKTTSIPHRSISAISNFSMPRTQSPYQGATGPSHPYGMYPQDIGLARNPSSATNSMARVPEASYAGPDGPTQPYGMYSQNTLPEDEADRNADVIRAIPGFPGREQNFQRRFGQDGEDAADLVGPDGYMEQLPPYTRYANNIPPKVGTTGPEIAGDVSRNLPADSQDTLNTAQSRDFAAGALIRDGNPTQPNSSPSGASAPSDGGHFKERCKERGKKKVCFGRIPMWLVMIILLILAVLIGAVIGGVLGHVDKEASEDNAPTPSSPNFAASTITVTTTTSLVDAVPITSTNLPSPPTGSFYVALDQPSNSSKDCLTNAQKQAWDCNSDAVMNINVNTSDTNDWRVSFSYNNTDGQPKSTRPMYGAQPPELKGYAAAEPMMAKGEDWGKGPAYVFHQEFDKLVILHEDAFNSTNAKRWLSDEMYTNQVLNKRVEDESDFVTEGERPWYCYWNGTVLEGFIFVGKDLTTTSATSPTTYSHENFAVSSLPSESYVSAAHASDWGRKPTVSFPSSDPAFTTISSLIDGSIPTLPIAMETGVMAQRKRHQDVSSPVETPYYDSIEQYPKMIKIEERRNFQSQETPYCQQMEISEQGIANPIENCRFDLSETESDSSRKRRSLSWALSIFKRKRSEYASSCGCEWMLQ